MAHSLGVYKMNDDQRLVGTWSLVKITINSSCGKEIFPFGEQPSGQIIYTSDGDMSLFIMRTGRAHFASGDSLSGTPGEIKQAFEGFDAYSGKYSVDRQKCTVFHYIEISRFPNWEGTTQVRNFSISNNELILIAPPIRGLGQEWAVTLNWERK